MTGPAWYFAAARMPRSGVVELHLCERPSARAAWVSRSAGRAALEQERGRRLLGRLPRSSVVYHRSQGREPSGAGRLGREGGSGRKGKDRP